MLTIEQALLQYNSRLTNEILANPDFRSATASGNFANFVNTAQSIELKSTPERVEFTKYGTSYTTALDKGTPPGQAQGLAKDIYEMACIQKVWAGLEKRKTAQELGRLPSIQDTALGLIQAQGDRCTDRNHSRSTGKVRAYFDGGIEYCYIWGY